MEIPSKAMVNESLLFGNETVLAIHRQAWHGAAILSHETDYRREPVMAESSDPQRGSNKSAGGFFIAAGCVAGAIIGGFLGQPSIGFLVGLASGAAIAVAVWYFDR